jgi:hypothetical protein
MSIRGGVIEIDDINESYVDNTISADHYEILIKLREENNSLLIRMRDHENMKMENIYLKSKFDEFEKNNLILKEENGYSLMKYKLFITPPIIFQPPFPCFKLSLIPPPIFLKPPPFIFLGD